MKEYKEKAGAIHKKLFEAYGELTQLMREEDAKEWDINGGCHLDRAEKGLAQAVDHMSFAAEGFQYTQRVV